MSYTVYALIHVQRIKLPISITLDKFNTVTYDKAKLNYAEPKRDALHAHCPLRTMSQLIL